MTALLSSTILEQTPRFLLFRIKHRQVSRLSGFKSPSSVWRKTMKTTTLCDTFSLFLLEALILVSFYLSLTVFFFFFLSVFPVHIKSSVMRNGTRVPSNMYRFRKQTTECNVVRVHCAQRFKFEPLMTLNGENCWRVILTGPVLRMGLWRLWQMNCAWMRCSTMYYLWPLVSCC